MLKPERFAACCRLRMNCIVRILAVLGIVLAWSTSVAADSPGNVLIIADLESNIHKVFIETLKQDDSIQQNLKVVDTTDFANPANEDFLVGVRLLIPVGVSALRTVIDAESALPVWAALIPKRSYETLIQQATSTDQYSAWFIDQPLSRRFDLLKLVLPTAKRIGVMVGESPDYAVQALKDVAATRSFELVVRQLKDEQDAVAQTQKLGEIVDAMLAVPDRVSLNLNNAKGILLSAYRQRLPIVGYTRAYVSAGALAAVYSMPEQIAKHLIEELAILAPDTQIKSDLHYPKYFSVAVNSQVARSLGIQLPSQNSLLTQLQESE